MRTTMFIAVQVDHEKPLSIANVTEYAAAQLCDDKRGPFRMSDATVYTLIDDIQADIAEGHLILHDEENA